MMAAVDVNEYNQGFGDSFATEALPGALPVGQNSPQKVRGEWCWAAHAAHTAADS
jgi:homogentisate 1,2-dioxygenase